ncbi:hypothetical protein FACS1894208_06630 [Clostridia bacterium]|nr:hypothetical protein FACS1894208_06630 [Clostridia bacterium]
MRFELHILLHGILTLCDVLSVAFFFHRFLAEKYNRRVYWLMYAAYFALSFTVSITTELMEYRGVVSLGATILAALVLYKFDWRHRIFTAALVLLYRMISEPLATVTVAWISNSSFAEIEYNSATYFQGGIFSTLIYIAIITAIARKHKKHYSILPNRYFSILLMMVVMCTILAYVDLTLILSNNRKVQFLHFLSEGCISGLSVFLYFVFERFHRHTLQELQTQIREKRFAQQEHQMKMMQTFQSEIRKINHDFKKHMTVLRNLSIDESKGEELRQYIAKYTDTLETIVAKVYTGIPSLDALLSANEAYAMTHNIRMTFRVSKLGELEISPVDLNIIVGNALDNAIEACERLPVDMERFVELGLSSLEDTILMMITNSSIPLKNLNREMFAAETSKADKNWHGIGLEAIRDTVEKYGGIADFEAKGSEFILRARFWNSAAPPPHEVV